MINNETEKINLITIICDFEIALINSISDIFKNIYKVGCYFHHKQCLRRKAQKLGLMKKPLIEDSKKLINSELGIFPFKNFNCNKDIINALEELKKQFKNHTELIEYYKKEWLQYFENKMLCYKYIPKKIRSTSYLENYNGLLLKITHNKKILTWPEYINLLINEELKYKLKIINYESSYINNNNFEEKLISNNIIMKKKYPDIKYFFNWKNNSCRFDCFCFILTYKLIGILENNIIHNKDKLTYLKSFAINLRTINNKILNKGFFEYYKILNEDCLNIKNNLD